MDKTAPIIVTGQSGLVGLIMPAELAKAQASNGSQMIALQLENGQEVSIPAYALIPQSDGTYRLQMDLSQLNASATAPDATGASPATGSRVIPVFGEELQVEKRQVVKGGIRVHKNVKEQTQVVDEPLLHKEVEVERRAVNQLVDAMPQVRYENDLTVIPIVEEVLVVEKRLMLKEEVYIRQTQFTTHQPQHFTLQREEAVIEPIEANPGANFNPNDQANPPASNKYLEFLETDEEPVVNKQTRVIEEVVVNKEAEYRTETIRDKVRRNDVVVEPINAPPPDNPVP